MQRIATFLIILFAAFNSGCATPTKPAPVSEAPPIAAPAQSAPAPAASTPEAEAPVAKTFPLAAVALPPEAFTTPQREGQKPHIALLLPLKSAAFGPAAEAVRQGAITASGIQTPVALPLQVYPTDDQVEDIVSAYRQALQAGAKIVIGPLTRNAVTALAKSDLVTVPTLALNYPEGEA
ncbi:MAG: penicillin-binding protein activator, partial [Sulfuricella sp.]|nr:penicillin-binding protein activator [Sulfuricella sp.]